MGIFARVLYADKGVACEIYIFAPVVVSLVAECLELDSLDALSLLLHLPPWSTPPCQASQVSVTLSVREAGDKSATFCAEAANFFPPKVDCDVKTEHWESDIITDLIIVRQMA